MNYWLRGHEEFRNLISDLVSLNTVLFTGNRVRGFVQFSTLFETAQADERHPVNGLNIFRTLND